MSDYKLPDLDLTIAKANEAGLSYGNYVALYGVEYIPDNTPRKTCPVCGRKFISSQPRKRFCSYDCRTFYQQLMKQ